MIDDRIVAHVARLEYFQSLNALNLDGVPPTAHARSTGNVLRDDVAGPCLDLASVLANAPAVQDGYFVVPPVITEE